MRLTVLGVSTALFGLVLSQTTTLPACAQTCVTNLTSGGNIGNCPSLDIKCICSSSTFLSNIACCLVSVCSASDQAAAVVYAKQICTTAGVTVPDAVVCNSASGSGGASSAASTTSAAAGTSSAASAMTTSAVSATSASASASSSVSKAGGFQNAPGAGISFAGGLFAALALL